MTGHRAEQWRAENDRRSPQEREQTAREHFQHWIGGAELSDIKTSASARPYPACYARLPREASWLCDTDWKTSVPHAGVLRINHPARFTDSSRKYGIYFPFPWADVDDIDIQLPEGYVFDHADAPAGLKFNPVGSYEVRFSITKTNHLLCHRQLVFGSGNAIVFDSSVYGTLKQIFDAIHNRDAHMVTLKVQQPAAVKTAEAK